MKKLVIILISLMCVNLASAQKFHLEDREAPTEPLPRISGQECWEKILKESGIKESKYNIKTHSAKDKELVCFDRNACFEGFLTAYDNHYSLVLSPDMIWLLISQGISTHINMDDNAETLRERMVDFEGQKELIIALGRDVLEYEEDWDWIIQAFSDSIDSNMKSQFSDLMVCNFSTTGTLERITSQIGMMESVRKYFRYTMILRGCGIPDITLLGTPDDWKEIRSRIKRLDDLDLGWWREMLEPVLDEFVNASEGRVNRDFWLDMVNKYAEAGPGVRGCGAVVELPAQYNGWFTVFFPFCEEDIPYSSSNHVIRTPKTVSHNTMVCSEIKKADVKYIKPDVILHLELWAGFIGMEMDWENHSLKPAMSWMVRVK